MAMIKMDHQTLEDLFGRFGKAGKGSEKRLIIDAAIKELRFHIAVEEQLFYPAVRRAIAAANGLMDQAAELHHGIKLLVEELALMTGMKDNVVAKFMILGDCVRRHIEKVEMEMLPKASRTGIDFEALGQRMETLRKDLNDNGFPQTPESMMVQSACLRAVAPAREQRRAGHRR